MKIQKLSFGGIKNVLSRDELKKIMAGSGSCSPSSCTNDGLAIPCCQCYPTKTDCFQNVGYDYLKFPSPIPYECNCFCQAWGYSGGYNDCPNNAPVGCIINTSC